MIKKIINRGGSFWKILLHPVKIKPLLPSSLRKNVLYILLQRKFLISVEQKENVIFKGTNLIQLSKSKNQTEIGDS